MYVTVCHENQWRKIKTNQSTMYCEGGHEHTDILLQLFHIPQVMSRKITSKFKMCQNVMQSTYVSALEWLISYNL